MSQFHCNLKHAFNKIQLTLSQSEHNSIPKFVKTALMSPIQTHAASMRAYAVCVYIRWKSAEDIKVSLLTAKSKVAPLKTKTLPRLDLCAAYPLAYLCRKSRSNEVNIDRIQRIARGGFYQLNGTRQIGCVKKWRR